MPETALQGQRHTVIWPLSGTSSYSNDTVLVHGLSLFTVAIAFVSISLYFLGELKLIDKSPPTS